MASMFEAPFTSTQTLNCAAKKHISGGNDGCSTKIRLLLQRQDHQPPTCPTRTSITVFNLLPGSVGPLTLCPISTLLSCINTYVGHSAPRHRTQRSFEVRKSDAAHQHWPQRTQDGSRSQIKAVENTVYEHFCLSCVSLNHSHTHLCSTSICGRVASVSTNSEDKWSAPSDWLNVNNGLWKSIINCSCSCVQGSNRKSWTCRVVSMRLRWSRHIISSVKTSTHVVTCCSGPSGCSASCWPATGTAGFSVWWPSAPGRLAGPHTDWRTAPPGRHKAGRRGINHTTWGR